MDKLYGLDLFSGIGGISKALEQWVSTVAYCERDTYAQAVLLSRMASYDIDSAPIWDDVTSLRGSMLPDIDIIYGGFPCQDISVAGNGAGLEGKRSGLFFEIIRLAQEIKPKFIFLENVPAIRTRGLDRVIQEFTQVGYDCRWTMLSAADIGANHKRERWFLLGHAASARLDQRLRETSGPVRNESGQPESERRSNDVAHAASEQNGRVCLAGVQSHVADSGWWDVEPAVGRVVDGIPNRVDRLKCLGNAVVPAQAKAAFKELMGLK